MRIIMIVTIIYCVCYARISILPCYYIWLSDEDIILILRMRKLKFREVNLPEVTWLVKSRTWIQTHAFETLQFKILPKHHIFSVHFLKDKNSSWYFLYLFTFLLVQGCVLNIVMKWAFLRLQEHMDTQFPSADLSVLVRIDREVKESRVCLSNCKARPHGELEKSFLLMPISSEGELRDLWILPPFENKVCWCSDQRPFIRNQFLH